MQPVMIVSLFHLVMASLPELMLAQAQCKGWSQSILDGSVFIKQVDFPMKSCCGVIIVPVKKTTKHGVRSGGG